MTTSKTPVSIDTQSMSSNTYAWYVVAVLLSASIVGYIDRLVMGFLVDPIKADMGFTDTQMGILNGLAFAFFYVLMGIPLGRLIDTKNRKVVLSTCIIIWSTMTAFCGLAKNYLMLFLARVGVGIGEAALNPGAISIISDLFSKERVSKPIAVYTLAFYIGGGLAIILGGQLIEFFNSLGDISVAGFTDISAWRLVFISTGLPGLVIAIILIFTVKEPARSKNHNDSDEHPALNEVFLFLNEHKKLYALLFGGLISFGFFLYAVLGWYPAILMRTYGISPSDVANSYGFVYLIAGTSGALSAPIIMQWLERKKHIDAPLILFIGSMCLMIVPGTIGPLMPTLWLCLTCFAITKFCWGMIMTCSFTAIVIVTPGRMRGFMTGLYMVLMNITGGSLGTVLVGFLSDNWFGPENIRYAMALLAGICLPLSALMFFLLRPVYREKLYSH